MNKNGYLQVLVRGINTDFVCYKAHRFVYEVFKGSIPNSLVIDHINKIKTDNRLENLDLVTQQENSRRGDAGGVRYSKSIISINLETSEGMKFKSITSAAKYHKIDSARVKDVAYGKRRSATYMITFDQFLIQVQLLVNSHHYSNFQ